MTTISSPPVTSLMQSMQAEVLYFIRNSPNHHLTALNTLQGEAERKAASFPAGSDRERWEFNATQFQKTIAALLKIADSEPQQIDFDTLNEASKLKILLEEFSGSSKALLLIKEFAERPKDRSVLDQIEDVKQNVALTRVKQSLRRLWVQFGAYLQAETSRSNRGLFTEILDTEQMTKFKRWVLIPLEDLSRDLQSNTLLTKTSGYIPIFTMGRLLGNIRRVIDDKGKQARALKFSQLLEMFDKEVEPHIEELNQCRAFSAQHPALPFL